MNMWEEQMSCVIQEDPYYTEEKWEEDSFHPYGCDYYGIPYTEEDARSSYEDSEYHARREGD